MRMRQKGRKMSAKKQSEKRKRSFDGMNSAEFAIKWKRAFAGGVPQAVMQERVDAPGCFLWHIFSWGDAKHLEREAASAAFDKADKAGAFIAQEYSFNGGGKKTEYFFRKCPPDLKSADLAGETEVFVVGKNFAWTYVVTHETYSGLGPYFACRGQISS